MALEGRSSKPLVARFGVELYVTNAVHSSWIGTNMGQQTCDTKDTGTRMMGASGPTPSGRRRSHRATASCTRNRSLPRASGIGSGIPRMASSCDNRRIRPFASLDLPRGSGKNHAPRKSHSCARTWALGRQFIGGRRRASVTVVTGMCDAGYGGDGNSKRDSSPAGRVRLTRLGRRGLK